MCCWILGAPGATWGFGWGCTHDPAFPSDYLDCADGSAGNSAFAFALNSHIISKMKCRKYFCITEPSFYSGSTVTIGGDGGGWDFKDPGY
jgi:hypothetical protein